MKKFALLVVFFAVFSLSVFADDDAILDVPGRIAYIGDDFNVYSLSLHDGGLVTLTEDGSEVQHYEWPTWSDSGKLAFFCCDPVFSGRPGVEAFVSEGGMEAAVRVYNSSDEVFTYASWSPQDCDEGTGCRDLAMLLSQPGRGIFEVEIVRSNNLDPERQLVGEGSPFYSSWSPDGTQMLLFRENRRLDIYSVTRNETEKVQELPGFFQAPSWSPVDDRLLIGRLGENGDSTDLVILANDETRVLVDGLTGLVSFTWSPDGNYVAYRTATDSLVGTVTIVDAVTGEVVSESAVENVLAFFWAPDSEKIAFVTLSTPRGSFNASLPTMPIANPAQQTEGLAWGVLDIETDETWVYGAFVPTSEMIYMFNFFDQFAQSHQVWSPDSTHIVFSEQTPEGNSTISVLDMTRQNSVPFFIADGVIGIWSYN